LRKIDREQEHSTGKNKICVSEVMGHETGREIQRTELEREGREGRQRYKTALKEKWQGEGEGQKVVKPLSPSIFG